MKAINNVTLRILFAIILGVLLIAWPAAAVNYLVVIVGMLFLIPGLITVLGYLFCMRKQNSDTKFPVEGIGSALFGLVLVSAPRFFVGILMYVLGALLLLGGISQIRKLIIVRKWTQVSAGFYPIPVLIALCGLIVLCNPFKTVENAFMILGFASLVYSVSELINYMKFSKKQV